MKKLYIILALALISSVAAEAQTVAVTFRVTLKGTGKKLHADGLRVTGALTAAEQPDWNPASAKKMALVGTTADSVYAITLTLTRPADNIIKFKFINGADWGDGAGGISEDERGLSGTACAVAGGGDRTYTLQSGAAIMMPAYRFNTCTQVLAGVNELSTASNMDIYPNPTKANTTLTFDNPNSSMHSLEILNVTGQIVRNYAAQTGSQFNIERGAMPSGMYFARVKNTLGESRTVRFIME